MGTDQLPAPDPRVYFAAERTLLAWVRTGVNVIGLGFVVARFGLFLKLLQPAARHAQTGHGTSGLLGAGITLFGGIITTIAAIQFVTFLRELAPHERPRTRLTERLSVVLAVTVSAVGVVLGALLLVTG